MKNLWVRLSLVAVCISFLVACGSSNTESTKPTDSTSHNSLSVMGVDGPMAGADVDVFDLQAYLDDSLAAPSLLLSPATTDSVSALAENIDLIESAGSGPFIVTVTANAFTIDLTTGLSPVIGSVSTIIPELNDNRVYASPLTTLAVAIASNGRSDAAEVVDELDSARVATITHFGFGMNFDIDFFTVPPVLDETTHSVALQQQVTEYRTAAEVFATVVEQLVKADTFSTHADAVKAIALDVSDDVIDDVRVLAEIENVDEFYLTNKKRLSGSVVELLESDSTGLSHSVDSSVGYSASSSFSEIFVKQYSSVVSANVDSDLDGISDDIDNCINTPNADQLDRGGINSSIADGIGDACQCGDVNGSGDVDNTDAILIKRYTLDLLPSIMTDHCNVNGGNTCDNTDAILIQRAVLGLPPGLAQTCMVAVSFSDIDSDNVADGIDNCPADANTNQLDADSDGVGDVCDAYPNDIDNDDVSDDADNCPLVTNTSQADYDNDAQGDACDTDDDNDSVLDINDTFPNNSLLAADPDADGVDSGSALNQLQDNCSNTANPLQENYDNDAQGDACDADDDNDSVADVDDAFPTNPTETADSDNDGVGDNADAFPNDPNNDTDGDTLANANDPDPLNSDSIYHFDFFYNQLSSGPATYKAAVVGETVTQSDGTIDIGIGVDSTTLDLGSDEAGTGTFDVRATYGTTEESVSYTGTDFSAPTPLLTYTTVTDDALANTVSLSNGVLSFTDEATAVNLTAWGKHNFIGSGRATLNGVSTTLASVQEQALSVLSFADGNSNNADLNADYGVVILDTVYGDDEETGNIQELVNLKSVVSLFTFDGSDALALANGSVYESGLGASDGAVSFSAALPEATGYSVSPSGAVTVTIDGEPSYGFTDSEGDLFTVGDPASRMYGVKLGAGVTNANLAHATFDLQGLVIESSNVTLNATTYVGAVATFNADGTALTLSGTISKAVSAFSDIALPLVVSATETINLSSNEITVADNGRLSPITFAGSGLELEGFYTANGGLLLRLVNSFAQAGGVDGVGLLAQGSILSLADAPFNGVRPQFCVEIVASGNACPELRDIEEGEITGVLTSEGQFVIGTWSEGISGSFTSLLRSNENTAQNFADINAAAGNDYEDYYLTQGILFGTPVNYITGQLVDSVFSSIAVANAEVTLLFNNTTVQTDSEGRYYIPLREDLPFAQDYLTVSILSDNYRSREINVELNSENPVQLVANNDYQYFTPAQLDDGLETKALSETGLDTDLINQLMQKVVQQDQTQGYKQLHSLLIYKDGALVLEEYNTGNDDFIRFEDNISRSITRRRISSGRAPISIMLHRLIKH